MSYYDDLRTMKKEINELINESKGKKIKLCELSVHYGMKFGFGRKAIENTLKDFKDQGRIVLLKDEFEVLA